MAIIVKDCELFVNMLEERIDKLENKYPYECYGYSMEQYAEMFEDFNTIKELRLEYRRFLTPEVSFNLERGPTKAEIKAQLSE